MGWTVPLRPVPSIRVSVVAMTVRAMPVSVRGAMALRPVSIAMMTAIWPAMPVHAGAMTIMHPGAVPVRSVVSLHAWAMPVRTVRLPGVSLHTGAVAVMAGMPLHVPSVTMILDMRGRTSSLAGGRNADPVHAD